MYLQTKEKKSCPKKLPVNGSMNTNILYLFSCAQSESYFVPFLAIVLRNEYICVQSVKHALWSGSTSNARYEINTRGNFFTHVGK
jgi:hypothetical protein